MSCATLQVPLRDGVPTHVRADMPWLQRASGSLDDIDRSLNEDDLQVYDSERVTDSQMRPFPTTGVYNGECVTGVKPHCNGRGSRGSYSKTGAPSSPRDPTSHRPPQNQATSFGHPVQHRTGHDDRVGSRSPRHAMSASPTHRLDQPRTVVT